MTELEQYLTILSAESFWGESNARSYAGQVKSGIEVVIDGELGNHGWEIRRGGVSLDSDSAFETMEEAKASLRTAIEAKVADLDARDATPRSA